MTAGWVAGIVRARAMAKRVLGTDAARQVAACRSLAEAQRMLQPTPFHGAAEPGLSLAAAQHAVADTILWDLRVLAGWLPRDGVSLLRLLAGWFEIANVDELLQALAGQPAGPGFQLGALATAWPRLSEASSTAELRRALAASAWGDPGGDTIREIRLAMRVRWAARVAASGGQAGTWATAAAALLRAAEFAAATVVAAPAATDAAGRRPAVPLARLTGSARPGQNGPGRPRSSPREAGPAADPAQAETDWWRRVESDGQALLRSSKSDSGPVLGAIVVMTADARRVQAALASAARGGRALEAYDAVA